jgi:uncharacterized protein involved in response to NO
MNQTRSSVFFSYAFRPFFLLAGTYAVLALVLWIAGFHGLRWPGAPVAITSLWHAREMALGFCGAVVAGFLLTAVATWTGRQPLRGPWLMVLVASWLLGRLAATAGGGLPQFWLAAADLAFPVLLAVLAGREILGGASRRNYGIAAMTWVLAVLTLLYHLGEGGIIRGGEQLATSLMVHLLAALIAVVGGRVIPLFTANWLRMRGDTRLPLPQPRLDLAAIGLIVAAGAADGFAPGTALAGVLCIVAGAVNLWRLAGWRGGVILANPLLWSLHLALCLHGHGIPVAGRHGPGPAAATHRGAAPADRRWRERHDPRDPWRPCAPRGSSAAAPARAPSCLPRGGAARGSRTRCCLAVAALELVPVDAPALVVELGEPFAVARPPPCPPASALPWCC